MIGSDDIEQSILVDVGSQDGGQYIVALYKGYYDESMSDGHPSLMTVAGYLILASEAAVMARKWKWKLKQYDLEYFHMVDCVHKAPPYDNSRMNDRDRDHLARYFIGLIKQHTAFGFAAVSNPKQYIDDLGLSEMGEPYSWSVYICATQAISWLKAKNAGDKIAFFFEAGPKNGAAIDKLEATMQRNKIMASYTFSRKKDVTLLQAGDILAYQATKHLKDQVNQARPARKDFLSLIEKNHNIAYMTSIGRDVQIMSSDPGLNVKPGEEERHKGIQQFMRLLMDEPSEEFLENYS